MSEHFTQRERLRSKKRIERLIFKSRSLTVSPLKAKFEITSEAGNSPVEVLFSVPKSKFKKAVERNRIRRRLRESYRKNKHALYNVLVSGKTSMKLIILYMSDKEMTYVESEEKIVLILQRLATEVLKPGKK